MGYYYLCDSLGREIALGECETLAEAEALAAKAMAQGPDLDWSDWTIFGPY